MGIGNSKLAAIFVGPQEFQDSGMWRLTGDWTSWENDSQNPSGPSSIKMAEIEYGGTAYFDGKPDAVAFQIAGQEDMIVVPIQDSENFSIVIEVANTNEALPQSTHPLASIVSREVPESYFFDGVITESEVDQIADDYLLAGAGACFSNVRCWGAAAGGVVLVLTGAVILALSAPYLLPFYSIAVAGTAGGLLLDQFFKRAQALDIALADQEDPDPLARRFAASEVATASQDIGTFVGQQGAVTVISMMTGAALVRIIVPEAPVSASASQTPEASGGPSAQLLRLPSTPEGPGPARVVSLTALQLQRAGMSTLRASQTSSGDVIPAGDFIVQVPYGEPITLPLEIITVFEAANDNLVLPFVAEPAPSPALPIPEILPIIIVAPPIEMDPEPDAPSIEEGDEIEESPEGDVEPEPVEPAREEIVMEDEDPAPPAEDPEKAPEEIDSMTEEEVAAAAMDRTGSNLSDAEKLTKKWGRPIGRKRIRRLRDEAKEGDPLFRHQGIKALANNKGRNLKVSTAILKEVLELPHVNGSRRAAAEELQRMKERGEIGETLSGTAIGLRIDSDDALKDFRYDVISKPPPKGTAVKVMTDAEILALCAKNGWDWDRVLKDPDCKLSRSTLEKRLKPYRNAGPYRDDLQRMAGRFSDSEITAAVVVTDSFQAAADLLCKQGAEDGSNRSITRAGLSPRFRQISRVLEKTLPVFKKLSKIAPKAAEIIQTQKLKSGDKLILHFTSYDKIKPATKEAVAAIAKKTGVEIRLIVSGMNKADVTFKP